MFASAHTWNAIVSAFAERKRSAWSRTIDAHLSAGRRAPPTDYAFMDVSSVRGAVVVRCAKAVLVAIVALLMTLIALDNIVNYDANWQFVHHVLAMDTIFPGSLLLWRAITAPGLQTAAYLSIITWESLCALVNIGAVVALVANARSASGYARALPIAAVGLTMVMLLFGAGFLAVGGEWFLMWQSKIWNGTEAATRYFGIAAFTLIVLLAGERSDERA